MLVVVAQAKYSCRTCRSGSAVNPTSCSVHPVLRANAGVRVSAVESLTADVIGVDPAALTRVHSWDNVVGASDPADAARRITVANPAPEPGIRSEERRVGKEGRAGGSAAK